MKQATGNKVSQTANKVSIQQSLDGHSFSVHGLDACAEGNAAAEVEVLSERTMLVPRELFDAARCGALLAASGMPLAEGQRAVHSDPGVEVVAVMALAEEAAGAVETKLDGRAVFTTPLLTVPPMTGPTVWMHYTGQLLYIKVYDAVLRLAEVIPAPADADLVYLAERLANAFVLRDYSLHAAGPAARRLRKVLGKRFKETICE